MENSLAVTSAASVIQSADKTFGQAVLPFIEEWFKSDNMSDVRDKSRQNYRKCLTGKTYSVEEEKAINDELKKNGKPPRKFKKESDSKMAFAVWIDAQQIKQPTKEDFKTWKKAMKAAGLSVATINLRLTTVRNFYKWLSSEYGIVNIAANVKGYTETKEHRRGFLSLEEMRKLMSTVDNADLHGKRKKTTKNGEEMIELRRKRDKAILAVLMAGGLRTIEISRLLVKDINRKGGQVYLSVLGKGRDEHEDVKISNKAEQLIQTWLDAREAVDLVSDNSPLFCSLGNNSFGEPISSNSVSTLCKFYLKEAKLKKADIVAHSLRHSLAHNAIEKGANPLEVQQQLRHSNFATTQIYIHEVNKAKNKVSDIISDEIF